jgi:Mg2+/Co2+ transporter CorB
VVLIFSEITPKTYAAIHPEKVAFKASYILRGLLFILWPLVSSVNVITNGILKLFDLDPKKRQDESITSEELRSIVGDAGHRIPDQHQAMLLNILNLESATVNDILIPRNEIYGINLDDDDSIILQKIRQSEFTRIAVYQKDLNNVLGLLHLRTAGRFIREGSLDRPSMLQEIQKPYFIPENTPLTTQLLHFQKVKNHFALVVDEYGDILGAVTIEDILEEIVGEISASNMKGIATDAVQQKDGSWILDGTANIRDINRITGWNLPSDGPKTISGLILEHLESFPEAEIGLKINNFTFEVLQVQDNVVTKARGKEI